MRGEVQGFGSARPLVVPLPGFGLLGGSGRPLEVGFGSGSPVRERRWVRPSGRVAGPSPEKAADRAAHPVVDWSRSANAGRDAMDAHQ